MNVFNQLNSHYSLPSTLFYSELNLQYFFFISYAEFAWFYPSKKTNKQGVCLSELEWLHKSVGFIVINIRKNNLLLCGGEWGPFFRLTSSSLSGSLNVRTVCLRGRAVNVHQQVPAAAHGITHSVICTDEHRAHNTHAWLSWYTQMSESCTRILSADLFLRSALR